MKLSIVCILCLGGLVLGELSAGLRAAEEETGTGPLIINFDKVIAGPADLGEGVVPEGRVTLPYAEMRRLWLAVQQKGAKPKEEASPIDAVVASAEYHVQQSGALDWTVDIPSLDQVLSCEVDGEAVKPVRRSETELEFHLKATTSGDSGDGTVVRFSYALQSSAFDPVSGQVVVDLPQTDLFIHRLDWDLEIPQAYETTALEGNVQLAAVKVDKNKKAAVAKSHLIRLHKELCRGERPSVELYYRRRGIDD